MVNTHPGVLGLLDFRDSLCPGQVIHLLKGLHFAQERPLRGIVRAVLQRFAVLYWGAVYKASGAAGRVGRFESCGGRRGFGFYRRVLSARELAARGTAWTRVVVSRGVVLPPRRLHLRQHFYLKDKFIWRRTALPNWITGFPHYTSLPKPQLNASTGLYHHHCISLTELHDSKHKTY